MKKIYIPLVATCLSLFTLSSCGEDKKINNYKVANTGAIVRLSEEEVAKNMTNKEDMPLYVSDDSCLSCQKTLGYLKTYVAETENLIYNVTSEVYLKLRASNEDLYPSLPGYPYFVFVKAGKVLTSVSGAFDSSDALRKMLQKNLLETPVYYLNTLITDDKGITTIKYDSTDTLDEKLKSSPKTTVLFTWGRCGDCQEFKNVYFDEFSTTLNARELVYVYDTDYYRSLILDKNDPDYQYNWLMWALFTTAYGFNDFRDGKVPALVTFENNTPKEFAIYVNHTDVKNDADGLFYYDTVYDPILKEVKGKTQEELNKKIRDKELELIEIFLTKYVKEKKI